MKIYLLMGALLFVQSATAQILTGRVRAAPSKTPLAGATVQWLQSGQVTATNEQGHFSIPLPFAADTLEVSYVGYTIFRVAVPLGAVKPVEVLLYPASADLQEILVSTGYENLPRERVTGAFTHIDNQTLNLQTGTGILERLNGVAGSVLFDDGERFDFLGIDVSDAAFIWIVVKHDQSVERTIDSGEPPHVEV
ncbi:MAG: carboxypeptidase-like regulatory domain-containing protein, partial [Agriterribacter sp.]